MPSDNTSHDAFTLIPPGRYKARGITAELGETLKGEPQIGVLLEILEEGPWAGHRMTWYGYFTDKSQRRTIESLKHLGWSTNDLENLAGIDQAEVLLTVEHERVKKDDVETGEVRARAVWINAFNSVGIAKPLEENKKKALAGRMKGLAMQIGSGAPPAAKTTAGAYSTAGRPPAPPRSTGPASAPPAPAAGQSKPAQQAPAAAMQLTDNDIPF